MSPFSIQTMECLEDNCAQVVCVGDWCFSFLHLLQIETQSFLMSLMYRLVHTGTVRLLVEYLIKSILFLLFQSSLWTKYRIQNVPGTKYKTTTLPRWSVANLFVFQNWSVWYENHCLSRNKDHQTGSWFEF